MGLRGDVLRNKRILKCKTKKNVLVPIDQSTCTFLYTIIGPFYTIDYIFILYVCTHNSSVGLCIWCEDVRIGRATKRRTTLRFVPSGSKIGLALETFGVKFKMAS